MTNLKYAFLCVVALFVRSSVYAQWPDDRIDLSGRGLTEVPDSVFYNFNLKSLDLGSSAPDLFPKRLGFADENSNQLTWLPREIGLLKGLKSLILNSNLLFDLPYEITELRVLDTLDLALNPRLNIKSQIPKLQKMPSLEVLCIYGSDFKSEDIYFFQKHLPGVKIIFDPLEYISIFQQKTEITK